MQAVGFKGFPYDNPKKYIPAAWSLFPPNPFNEALRVLVESTSTSDGPGVSWSGRGKCVLLAGESLSDCAPITIVCHNIFHL